MKLFIDATNYEQKIDMFIMGCVGCPKFVNVWDYLKMNKKRCAIALSGLAGLLDVIDPNNKFGALDKEVLEYIDMCARALLKIGTGACE